MSAISIVAHGRIEPFSVITRPPVSGRGKDGPRRVALRRKHTDRAGVCKGGLFLARTAFPRSLVPERLVEGLRAWTRPPRPLSFGGPASPFEAVPSSRGGGPYPASRARLAAPPPVFFFLVFARGSSSEFALELLDLAPGLPGEAPQVPRHARGLDRPEDDQHEEHHDQQLLRSHAQHLSARRLALRARGPVVLPVPVVGALELP